MAEWTEYPVIWLSPWCQKCELERPISEYEGRQWCESPESPCDECGKGWTRYEMAKAGEPAPDVE